MNTEQQISIDGLRVEIVRKDIKNLHLGVYPPNGRVRVAAPLRVNNDAVRLAVIGKLGWIKRQQARFESQPRQSEREMLTGESHYFLGKRYRLEVLHENKPAQVELKGENKIILCVRQPSTISKRETVVMGWYRRELRTIVNEMISKWQKKIGVEVRSWAIKKMKTRWGTCNQREGRVWLNLELVKKPIACIEYIVVHELLHLIEKEHNERFVNLMTQYLPKWRREKEELNCSVLSHEEWDY